MSLKYFHCYENRRHKEKLKRTILLKVLTVYDAMSVITCHGEVTYGITEKMIVHFGGALSILGKLAFAGISLQINEAKVSEGCNAVSTMKFET